MTTTDQAPPSFAAWPALLANKAILILIILVGTWLVAARVVVSTIWVLAAYSLLTGLYLLLLTRPAFQRRPPATTTLYAAAYLTDLAFVLYLIDASGGLLSPFWPLLALQVLFPAFYLPWSSLIWLGAFASGPLYILALWLHANHSLAFLTNPLFLARYAVLFLAAIASAVAAEHLHHLHLRQQTLERTLATREADLDAQAKRLQRTAADLGDRVLQLRSLQEITRALAATLDLPDTLAVLVERLAALTDARGAAIALIENDGETLRGAAAAGPDAVAWPANIRQFELSLLHNSALHLLNAGNIIASEDATREDASLLGFDQLRQLWQMEHFLCLPLLLRGRPLGALYLADASIDASADRQRQLLDSFSYFAATAVENARLYQAVADKSRELETILAGIGDGVLVVDAELQLVLMNPVAAHIFALESPPPVGLPIHLFIADSGILDLLNQVRTTPYQAHVHEMEQRRSAPHAEPAIFQALATPLVVGSDLHGIATVLRDITAQKDLERMKSNFLSVVSHELKTPLHSVKGFVDIILMGKTGPVTEIQRDFLETVKQQTDHLQRLIDDLLEFSRLESGRVTLRLQPVDLPVVIEAVLDKLTPLANSAEVTLVNRTPENLPSLLADPWRLEQVVTNLVDNAIKFTPPQGAVTISAADLDDYLQVSVADTGIGIPPGEIERIFDRFYQVDGGANRLYKGAGLGLTICRHIVEHHGGRIWVKSDFGKDAAHGGATFTFTLDKHLRPSDIGNLDFTTLPQKTGLPAPRP